VTHNERREKIAVSAVLNGIQHIGLYGAGNQGQITYNKLIEFGYRPEFFLDKRAGELKSYCGIPVYTAEELPDEKKNGLAVLVSLLVTHQSWESLKERLNGLGYDKVAFTAMLDPTLSTLSDDDTDITKCVDEILAAFELMSDENSEIVFMNQFCARASSQLETAYCDNPGMTQYFDVNVPFRNKYRNFVDCGAFTGDTLEDFLKHHNAELYIGFEPDLSNFAKLSVMAKKYCDRINSICLPLGVSDTNGFVKFNGGNDSTCAISDDGTSTIQVAQLDDLLHGQDNLMIKMDIEGAEIAALSGAKRIITSTAPDLAICVYHKTSDMWKIPLLLHEWVPEYTFYMRSHFDFTIETVLYATAQ
jgi:FkbM family methyltransferase